MMQSIPARCGPDVKTRHGDADEVVVVLQVSKQNAEAHPSPPHRYHTTYLLVAAHSNNRRWVSEIQGMRMLLPSDY